MDKLTFTEILFTVWYSKPLSNKIYIQKSFFFFQLYIAFNFEQQVSMLHQETISTSIWVELNNYCIIKNGMAHFDFLLWNGVKIMNLHVGDQTNSVQAS